MKKTKRETFLLWCNKRKLVSSVMALQYAIDNGYLDARKTLCELIKEGHAVRLNWSEKNDLGLMKAWEQEILWARFK